MAKITINLNNKSFPIECDESQIALVRQSASRIQTRFDELKSSSPMASTEYLLLLCAILLESENITKINEASENDIRSFEAKISEIADITNSITKILR